MNTTLNLSCLHYSIIVDMGDASISEISRMDNGAVCITVKNVGINNHYEELVKYNNYFSFIDDKYINGKDYDEFNYVNATFYISNGYVTWETHAPNKLIDDIIYTNPFEKGSYDYIVGGAYEGVVLEIDIYSDENIRIEF